MYYILLFWLAHITAVTSMAPIDGSVCKNVMMDGESYEIVFCLISYFHRYLKHEKLYENVWKVGIVLYSLPYKRERKACMLCKKISGAWEKRMWKHGKCAGAISELVVIAVM